MNPSAFLLILTCIFSSAELRASDNIFSDWEDPHDIFGKTKSVCGTEFDTCKNDLHHCRDELHSIMQGNSCKGPRVVKQPSVADHYIKRFINVLLSSADFKHRKLGEGNEMRVNLNLYFNAKTLPVLQAFASDDTNGHTWSELDDAFCSIFAGDSQFKANYASVSESEWMSTGTSWNLEVSHLTILIGVVSSIGLCIIWIYITGGSSKSALFVGGVIIVSFCFGWTWWSEIENQRMKFMAELSQSGSEEIPDSCKDPSSGLFGWFLKSSRQKDCLKYLRAKNIHPIVAVDLSKVFSKTLQTLAFSWIPALAKSASSAIDSFYGTSWFGSLVSWFARVATGPLMVITILLGLAVYMITRSSFKFKTFFFEIDFGSTRRQPGQDQIQNGRLGNDQEPNALNGRYSQPLESRKVKKVLSHKTRRPKLLRSESSHPLAASRRRSLYEPFTTKRLSEDRRFRELRRSYSVVERPTVDPDDVATVIETIRLMKESECRAERQKRLDCA